MAAYREKGDLIAIGAYQPGTDALTDAAIAARDPIDGFLRQTVDDRATATEADAALTHLALLNGVPEPAPVAAPRPGCDAGRAGDAVARRHPTPAPRGLVSESRTSTAVGGAGPRLPAPGIRSRATSMLADAVHRQARPGIRRGAAEVPNPATSAYRFPTA